jgi:hypothetical protein
MARKNAEKLLKKEAECKERVQAALNEKNEKLEQ